MSSPRNDTPEASDVGSEGIVSGSTMTKEVTMSHNFPAHVSANAASNEPIDVRTLSVHGIELSFRLFEDGYTSVNSVFGVAHKESLTRYGQIRGFIGALQTMLDMDGEIEPGFHCAGGVESALEYWSAPLDEFKKVKPLAYVNWKLLKNESRIAMLAEHGIVKEGTEIENRGRWIALSAARGSFFVLWPNVPQNWDAEFVPFLATKGITDTNSPEAKYFIDNYYEKAWNIQNRHDGFEVALRLLAGKLFVGMKFSPKNDAELRDAARLTTEFNMLWKGSEDRREHAATKKANGIAQRQIEHTAFAIAKSDSSELGEYAQAAIDSGKVTVFADGGVSKVKRAEIVGKHINFVYADGSRVNGSSPFIKNDALLTAALQMAQTFSALIAVA